jgi:hypothetical protein
VKARVHSSEPKPISLSAVTARTKQTAICCSLCPQLRPRDVHARNSCVQSTEFPIGPCTVDHTHHHRLLLTILNGLAGASVSQKPARHQHGRYAYRCYGMRSGQFGSGNGAHRSRCLFNGWSRSRLHSIHQYERSYSHRCTPNLETQTALSMQPRLMRMLVPMTHDPQRLFFIIATAATPGACGPVGIQPSCDCASVCAVHG